MQKTLTRTGNSYALTFTRELMDMLKMTPETPVEIRTDGVSVLVTPVRSADGARAERVAAAMMRVDTTFGPVFQNLAKR